ncbi:hypothetical protein LNV09_09170 [Paucibacter sp. B2R-40]|uniref:hypothetical protein n=1 Tax=Paucibacter sp. B2R-40 TaxID=2893554 RepID=UPI0021E504FF|nr:hypothetical protein [Paucibacter sp. B2R-40]MCV2354333.1 hypothetical protein [Paucibacter sp. B2R-40]
MGSRALSVYLEAEPGKPTALPRAGSSLEHPLVFDSAAQELKAMADKGLVTIIDEHHMDLLGEKLIDRLTFVKLR